MRETLSNHTQCLRSSPRELGLSGGSFRPNLNVPLLVSILSTVSTDLLEDSKSGKRKAPQSTYKARRLKRSKTSQGSRDHSEGPLSSDESDSSINLPTEYPTIRVQVNPTSSEELVPILCHSAVIQYTQQDGGDGVHEDIEKLKRWEDEEHALHEVLSALHDSSVPPESINLGDICFADYNDRAVGVPYDPRFHVSGHDEWLFLLPLLTIDAETHDTTTADLLTASRVLQAAGKAHINASLKIELCPEPHLLFALRLEFTVSLVLPAALDYTVRKNTIRKTVVALEDARRRLFVAAFTDGNIVSSMVNQPISVSSFYNILGPGPALESNAELAALQPEGLKPTLLPFQCRSVGWLLEREGMAIMPDGSTVQRDSPHTFSFWKQVQVGDHKWYLNTLSGDLVNKQPELPIIYGAMLAEEPGLGKTLETIALILLNPAPSDWNPTLNRWDEVARLDIKAVKVSDTVRIFFLTFSDIISQSTLIVTPPSLVSQWKEELATHAPSLKVLVYDGWSKLKVPIVNNDMELQRLAGLRLDDKPKKKAKAKAKPKRKGRRKGKGKAKAVDSSEDEDDMDVDKTNDGIATVNEDGERLEWCDYVHQFDVVITTYTVLRSEIYVARAPPDRPRRDEAVYSVSGRARSPLVMVKWKRVVMDEVQMVGGKQAT